MHICFAPVRALTSLRVLTPARHSSGGGAPWSITFMWLLLGELFVGEQGNPLAFVLVLSFRNSLHSTGDGFDAAGIGLPTWAAGDGTGEVKGMTVKRIIFTVGLALALW